MTTNPPIKTQGKTAKTLRFQAALLLGAVLILATVLAGCEGELDPYRDLDTDPPPMIENATVGTSGSISPKTGSDDLFTINVAGFLHPVSADPVRDLSRGDFVVVEDGTVKGIRVDRISPDATAAADVVFVFDTTGSMGGALHSVQDSIIAFAEFIGASGLDVRLGAVTFGDAYDTKTEGNTRSGSGSNVPPDFDWYERPTHGLTTDYEAFKTFVEEDGARDGQDTPENALGALGYAYDHMQWREGAQRILIVITDTCSHSDVTNHEAGITDPWIPPNPETLLGELTGSATVHVIAPPDVLANDWSCDDAHTDMAMFTGPMGTGGVFVPTEFGAFDFDLTELPLAAAAAGGYLITYRGTLNGETHTMRVVIDDGGEVRGEFTLHENY